MTRLREVRRVGVLGQRQGSAVLDARLGVQPHGHARRPRPRRTASRPVDSRPREILTPSLRARFVALLLPPRLRDGSFVTSGEEPATSMRTWMLDTLPRNAKTYKSDWVYEVVSGSVDGASRGRSCTSSSAIGRAAPAVAYGFELCFAQFAADGLKKVMAQYAILPPSLTGGVPNDSVPNDSIFSARVFDGNGHLIFKSEVQYPPTYTRLLQARLLRRPEERHRAAPDAGEDAAHRRAAERATPAAARRPRR